MKAIGMENPPRYAMVRQWRGLVELSAVAAMLTNTVSIINSWKVFSYTEFCYDCVKWIYFVLNFQCTVGIERIYLNHFHLI